MDCCAPLRKPRARHERQWIGRKRGGLPSATRRRRCAPTPFPPSLRLRYTFPARRPQTEAGCLSVPRHPAQFDLSLQQFACAANFRRQRGFFRQSDKVFPDEHFVVQSLHCGASQRIVFQMFKSAGEFYGRPTVELTNRRKRGTLERFFNQ